MDEQISANRNDDFQTTLRYVLRILNDEDELIIKPFHSDPKTKNERGKIVSKTNKTLFDYEIGDSVHRSWIKKRFRRRIRIYQAYTKNVLFEYFYMCFPFLGQISSKELIHCLPKSSYNEKYSIGSFRRRFSLRNIRYDALNNTGERFTRLILHRHIFRNEILHCDIWSEEAQGKIGRIDPYSSCSDVIGSRPAVTVKIANDLHVEIKTILMIGGLILKSRLN